MFLKTLKIKLSYNPAIPLLGIYPEKSLIQKVACTPIFIAAIYNSQDMEATWMSIKRVMDEEDVVWWRRYTHTYVYNGTLLSLKKNEIMHFQQHRWIYVDPRWDYHTKWSKSEKDKYSILISGI